MKVTMQKIAEAVGVSRGTVDRALHHRGRIDPEVKARIFDTARSMGYVIPGTGDGGQDEAGPKKEIRIGVITYLCNAGFMREINRGIAQAQEELKERGVRILLRESTAVDENEQLRFLENRILPTAAATAKSGMTTGSACSRLIRIFRCAFPASVLLWSF